MRSRVFQHIEEMAMFALPGVCLTLLAFAIAGFGFFLFGHFSGVAQMAHFGKVLMAPFGLALCAMFSIEMFLWLCAMILYAIDRKRSLPATTEGNAPPRTEVIEQNAAEPEPNSQRSHLWAYIILFSAAFALIGLVPLLLGVYRQERGLIVTGVWLVAPYGLIVAAWYVAIQIWQVTSRVDEIKTNEK